MLALLDAFLSDWRCWRRYRKGRWVKTICYHGSSGFASSLETWERDPMPENEGDFVAEENWS
jgi:hypothetical protein